VRYGDYAPAPEDEQDAIGYLAAIESHSRKRIAKP
jgi:hypothetical protein